MSRRGFDASATDVQEAGGTEPGEVLALTEGTRGRLDRIDAESIAARPSNHLGWKDAPEREFRSQYPEEYLEPMNRLSEKVEPYSDPAELVNRINPDYETGDGYRVNCADAARCFERSWRGTAEEAAGRGYRVEGQSGLFVEGEESARTEQWAGERFSDVYTNHDLRERIQAGGHGTSAIIHSSWFQEGSACGHAYNVVNHHGNLAVIDPQTHEVLPWDPAGIREGLPASSRHAAMVWDGSGARIW